MKEKVSIGGQAVIEGVMIRGTKYLATAVRKSNGDIVYKKTSVTGSSNNLRKKPFFRGMIVMFESLVLGIKELTFSANQSGEEGEALSHKEAILTTIVSLSLGIGLFIVLPSFIGGLIFPANKVYANLVEAVLRAVAFLSYIKLISFSKDIKRIFEYHGAEHKSIYAYENSDELIPENAQKYTTLHPRCGTSFLFIVMLTSIIVFAIVDIFMPVTSNNIINILMKLLTRVLLMPIVAGASYEIQRYSSQNLEKPLIKLLSMPGLELQKITTSEPDLEQLEVAIVAVKISLGEEVENALEVFE